jgi:hypothetical protein
MWRCVTLVLTDFSEEHIASILGEKSGSEEPVWPGGCGFFYPEDGGDKFLRKVS